MPLLALSCAGCASGEIFLWQFGARMAVAGYTPIPATAGATPPPASGSIFATPARSWAIDRPGALAALGHWGQPQAVRALLCPTGHSLPRELGHVQSI